MENLLRKLNPAFAKRWLLLLAGLMWSGAGLLLIVFASRWLEPLAVPTALLLILAGAALGAAIYAFGFSRLARKNIRRIHAYLQDRICLFAFQEWKSYPLVAVMISMGVTLRLYSPVPKPLLAILYLGIGSGLFASSLQYYPQVGKKRGRLSAGEQG